MRSARIYAPFALLIAGLLSSCSGGSGSRAPLPPSGSATAPPIIVRAPSIAQWTSGAQYAPAAIPVSWPAVPAAGDVVIVVFWNNGQTSSLGNTYSAPQGWTPVDVNAGPYATYEAFEHVVAAGETGNYTFTPLSPVREHVWIGADVRDSSGVEKSGDLFVNNSTSFSTLAVAPSSPSDLAIAFDVATSTAGGGWSTPPSWTVGAATTSPWQGQAVYQTLSSESPVAQAATSSLATTGFAGILLLSPSKSGPTPSPAATAAAVDWPGFGYDLQRTGYNPLEKTIGPRSFGTMHPTAVGLPNVGYYMQGEPALAMNVNVAGARRNVLYAGGQSGTFYALDADNGAVVWSAQLGTGGLTCPDTSSAFGWGVEGTPALDRPRNRVYVPDGANHVHALDLSTGAEAAGWPVTIAPVTGHDFIHAALTYNPANGLLYAETSGACDMTPWYGRIAAIDTSAASVVRTFYPEQGNSGGGIWGVGGASIDPQTNDVFVAVGNADSAAQTAFYAEQIVQLSADLSAVIAHNYPPNMPVMFDSDFGATPMLFQPIGCPPLLAALNKSGAFVLYNRSNIGAGPIQIVDMGQTSDEMRGVPAYDPVTNYVYVALPSAHDAYQQGIGAFAIRSDCTLNPTPVWNQSFGANADNRSPITIANGVVYVSGYSDNTTYAFDAASGGRLWSAGLSDAGAVGPIVASGRIYVGDIRGTIHAWQP